MSAGLPAPDCIKCPCLPYTLCGIQCFQSLAKNQRLPITASVMQHFLSSCSVAGGDQYEALLLWAISCLALFVFIHSDEFTLTSQSPTPAVTVSDMAVDSQADPSVVSMHLRRAKTNPFGCSISVFLVRTGAHLCHVAALFNYLVSCPTNKGPLTLLNTSLLRARAKPSALSAWIPRCTQVTGSKFGL